MAKEKKRGFLGKSLLWMVVSAFLVMGFRTSFERHFWKPFWKEHPSLDRWVKRTFRGLRRKTGRSLRRAEKLTKQWWRAYRADQGKARNGREYAVKNRLAGQAGRSKQKKIPFAVRVEGQLRKAEEAFWRRHAYRQARELWRALEKKRAKLSPQQRTRLDLGLGWSCLEQQGKPLVNAKRRFHAVLSRDSGNVSARFGLSLVWLRMGQRARGLRELKTLVREGKGGAHWKDARKILITYGVVKEGGRGRVRTH